MILTDVSLPLRIHSMSISPDMTGWNVKGLSAPFWRFYWNDRRGNFAHLHGRCVELMPDHCYVIPAETPFDAESRGPVHHLHIHFVMGFPYHRPEPAIHALAMDGDLGRVVHRAAAGMLKGGEEGDGERLHLLGQTIVLTALSRIDAVRPHPGADTPRLRRVLELLAREGSTISNAACAREAAMSTTAFIRWFRESTGSTPQAYRLSSQIDHACALLACCDCSIEQIAQSSGFCDRHYFSRVFKRLRSQSPAAFRRSVQSAGRGERAATGHTPPPPAPLPSHRFTRK